LGEGTTRPKEGKEFWLKVLEDDDDVREMVIKLWAKHNYERDLAVVDLFAGWAGIAYVFVALGFRARAFDRNKCSDQDFCTKAGYAVAIFFVLRLKEGGLLTAGPQCSTWIFIALGHTKRNVNIEGDTTRADVREGNLANARLAVLIKICVSRGVFWLVEQPSTSKFFEFNDMAEVLQNTPYRRIGTWMGHWGSEMPKCSILVGDVPANFEALAKPKPQNLKGGWGTEKTGKWVSGNANLPKSAAYPQAFVDELGELFASSTSIQPETLEDKDSDYVWEYGHFGVATGGSVSLNPISKPGGVKGSGTLCGEGSIKITEFFGTKRKAGPSEILACPTPTRACTRAACSPPIGDEELIFV
jgi:hypothetical protein